MSLALLDRPVITDDATRRRFLAGLAGAGLLTACAAPAPAAPAAPAATLTDDRGELVLPRVPERIVTTSEEATELVVALGLRPVGVGSGRVEAGFAGYYLTPDRLGTPEFVGLDPYNLEAITALGPDLIVHYVDDQDVATFERIAPTAVYDVTVPGAWTEALRRLGTGAGREREASAVIDGYAGGLRAARERLAPVVAAAPRVAVMYPNYGGGADTYVFGAEFALAAVLPELGFTLTGIGQSAAAAPGVGTISLERLGDIEADTLLALGPVDWRETPSAVILSTLDVPVLGVVLDPTRPSAGPLTSPALLDGYVAALAAQYAV